MKAFIKRLSVFTLALAMTIVFVSVGKEVVKANADTANTSYQYFYDQVSKKERAEKFYQAFSSLEKNGQFKNGMVEYDLVANEVISKEDVQAYVNSGDTKIPTFYGMGRDAYYMDHPDLFYVDVFSTSISAGQNSNKDYVAYLDSSRTLTLYRGNINTKEAVDEAVAAYEAKLAAIVEEAQASNDVVQQIKIVNQYIVNHVEYSFGTKVEDGRNVTLPEADYIETAYGALVNEKAICGGYAKDFKAVMDRLGIPCVCVQGYSLSSATGTYQPHMWNYVEVEGMWYAVDTTWNYGSVNPEEWLLVGGEKLSETHVEDNVVSSSGFELTYPAIKPYSYGNDTDANDMTIIGEYKDSTNNTGKLLSLSVSYEGKGAKKLEEEGKYLTFRTGTTDRVTKELVWSNWFNVLAFNIVWSPISSDKDDEVNFILHSGMEYIQFALMDIAPNDSLGAFYPNEPDRFGENAGKECYYAYQGNVLPEEHIIGSLSTPYRNNGYGSYLPAPGGIGSPANTGDLPVDRTYNIKITYNTKLKLVEGKTMEDVGMDYYTSKGNSTVKENAVLTDVKWDGDRVVTFTFTPSRMYIHNLATYYFTPTNLIGDASDKVPDYVAYTFKGKSVVCSKVFNDGRLYMSVFGEPKMLDDSDLSITDFKDENGNYYAESQRSQLILVANKPSSAKEQEMDAVLKKDTPIQSQDIVASSTYEIDLQICGMVRQVPKGSYMQVAFGFPEGYSPDDAGTTFKIYHYKQDNTGKIIGVEEIPVIVTQYGLIAQVKSFSPFTIVQLKNSSAAVTNDSTKNIYASVVGKGGTATTAQAEGKSSIVSLSGTDTAITYDIQASDGYQLSSILLNGKVIDLSRVQNGKLRLSASELTANNMLEVTFGNAEVAKTYEDRGITISVIGDQAEAGEPGTPGTPENPDNPDKPDTTPDNQDPTIAPKKNNTVGIVIGCIAAVLVVAGIAVAVVIVLKKKKANQ